MVSVKKLSHAPQPQGTSMPEVIFPGPEGRLEGRYHPQKDRDAPIAIVLHPHPQFGGTMNNRVVYNLHYAFYEMGFTVLRFNFRGVGRSQGEYDQGIGELSDAASALDYLQSMNNNAKHCWVAGFSFGAWIGMQLLMRRPEITGFISVSPPANMYDFSFLAPCPSPGVRPSACACVSKTARSRCRPPSSSRSGQGTGVQIGIPIQCGHDRVTHRRTSRCSVARSASARDRRSRRGRRAGVLGSRARRRPRRGR